MKILLFKIYYIKIRIHNRNEWFISRQVVTVIPLSKIRFQMKPSQIFTDRKDFFSECDQILSFLRIWSHLQKKYLMENFIFCAVTILKVIGIVKYFPTTEKWWHTWRRSMEKCLIMFNFYSLDSLWPYNWEIFAFKRHWNTLIFCDQKSAG